MKSEVKIPNLLTLQRQFKKELKNVKSITPKLISSTPSVPVKTRLQVYKTAYTLRVEESLIEDFPSLVVLLGAKKFNKMIWGYLGKFPSKYWTLAEVGENLSAYLKKSSVFLSDVAQMDWIKIKLELMALEKSDPQSFQNLREEDLVSKNLKVNSTLTLFSSSWNLSDLKGKPKKSPKPKIFVILQLNGVAKVLELSPTEKKILTKLNKKTISKLTAELEREKLSQEEIQKIFSRWVETGIILGLQ